MTSANKKVGNYDFRISYQYPMNGTTSGESSSQMETSGSSMENKNGAVPSKKERMEAYLKEFYPTLKRGPRVEAKMEERLPREKILFPQTRPKGTGDPNSSKGPAV